MTGSVAYDLIFTTMVVPCLILDVFFSIKALKYVLATSVVRVTTMTGVLVRFPAWVGSYTSIPYSKHSSNRNRF